MGGDLCKDCAEGSWVEQKFVNERVPRQYHHINGSMHEIAEKVRIDATREQKEAAEAKAKLDADEARREAKLTEIAKGARSKGSHLIIGRKIGTTPSMGTCMDQKQ